MTNNMNAAFYQSSLFAEEPPSLSFCFDNDSSGGKSKTHEFRLEDTLSYSSGEEVDKLLEEIDDRNDTETSNPFRYKNTTNMSKSASWSSFPDEDRENAETLTEVSRPDNINEIFRLRGDIAVPRVKTLYPMMSQIRLVSPCPGNEISSSERDENCAVSFDFNNIPSFDREMSVNASLSPANDSTQPDPPHTPESTEESMERKSCALPEDLLLRQLSTFSYPDANENSITETPSVSFRTSETFHPKIDSNLSLQTKHVGCQYSGKRLASNPALPTKSPTLEAREVALKTTGGSISPEPRFARKRVVHTIFGPALLLPQGPAPSSSNGPAEHTTQTHNMFKMNDKNTFRWSQKDDAILQYAVSKEGPSPFDWKRIATKYFSNARSGLQCKTRWINFMHGGKLAQRRQMRKQVTDRLYGVGKKVPPCCFPNSLQANDSADDDGAIVAFE